MGKIIGICCILAGACSGIAAWYLGKKEKIRRIEALLEFLRRTAEAVEQQTPMLSFLQSCPCRDVLLAQALQETAQELAANQWGSGEAAWEAAITEIGARQSGAPVQTEVEAGSQREKGRRTSEAGSRRGKERRVSEAADINWNMSLEQWEVFCGIGRIFGAESRDTILDILSRQNRQWEHFLEAERQQLTQQQRVVLPVGMLSGVMVVLLLL